MENCKVEYTQGILVESTVALSRAMAVKSTKAMAVRNVQQVKQTFDFEWRVCFFPVALYRMSVESTKFRLLPCRVCVCNNSI